MKRALLVTASILWMLFAFGFLFLLYEYLMQGAGLQVWMPILSSGSVLIGVMHFVGLCTAAVLCFAIGSGFWVRGFMKSETKKAER